MAFQSFHLLIPWKLGEHKHSVCRTQSSTEKALKKLVAQKARSIIFPFGNFLEGLLCPYASSGRFSVKFHGLTELLRAAWKATPPSAVSLLCLGASMPKVQALSLITVGGSLTLCPILHQWTVSPGGCVDPGHYQITICSHLTWKESFHKRTEFSCPSQDIHAQFSSVAQSCPILCDPMNRSTPDLPVHHQLTEFTQVPVHRVGDAIQPSHPLLSPSPPASNPSQHQGLFQKVSSLHEGAKVFEFQLQHQSFQWTPRTDLLQDGLVGSPCSPRDSQVFSNTRFQKHQFFGTQLSSQSNSHIHTWPLEKP